MRKDSSRLILIVFVFLLGGCNLPSRQAGMQTQTAAAETTRAAGAMTSTAATLQTAQAPGTPTPPGLPQTSATLTPLPERADFISDVTVPDGTTFAPGEAFTKTWRLKNTGSTPWTNAYTLAFFGGDELGAQSAPLTRMVAPGETADLSIVLTAPQIPGSYRSYWMLRDPQGNLFGIGSLGDTAFYVDIQVLMPTPTPTLAPFAVTKVIALASPPKYEGSCPTTVTIVGYIEVTNAGTVQYQWVRGSSGIASPETVTASGPGELQVQTTWVTSSSGAFQLMVISPAYLESNLAQFTVTCR